MPPSENKLHLHLPTTHLISLPNKLYPWSQTWSFKSLSDKNLPEKQVQAKSYLSKQIAETAKKCSGVNIEGKDVFESNISRPAPPPPAPFVFSSTLVEKKKVPLKASTVLNKVTPTPLASSSKSTKATKKP